jgi:hypothetical protein
MTGSPWASVGQSPDGDSSSRQCGRVELHGSSPRGQLLTGRSRLHLGMLLRGHTGVWIWQVLSQPDAAVLQWC